MRITVREAAHDLLDSREVDEAALVGMHSKHVAVLEDVPLQTLDVVVSLHFIDVLREESGPQFRGL